MNRDLFHNHYLEDLKLVDIENIDSDPQKIISASSRIIRDAQFAPIEESILDKYVAHQVRIRNGLSISSNVGKLVE